MIVSLFFIMNKEQFYTEVSKIQQNISCKKNTKAGISYSYRNIEEIYVEFKKVCKDLKINNINLIVSQTEGQPDHITCEATLTDGENSVSAKASVANTQVGMTRQGSKLMSDPQGDGAKISYCAKYAVQMLLSLGQTDLDDYGKDLVHSEKEEPKVNLNESVEVNDIVKPITVDKSGEKPVNIPTSNEGDYNVKAVFNYIFTNTKEVKYGDKKDLLSEMIKLNIITSGQELEGGTKEKADETIKTLTGGK